MKDGLTKSKTTKLWTGRNFIFPTSPSFFHPPSSIVQPSSIGWSNNSFILLCNVAYHTLLAPMQCVWKVTNISNIQDTILWYFYIFNFSLTHQPKTCTPTCTIYLGTKYYAHNCCLNSTISNNWKSVSVFHHFLHPWMDIRRHILNFGKSMRFWFNWNKIFAKSPSASIHTNRFLSY